VRAPDRADAGPGLAEIAKQAPGPSFSGVEHPPDPAGKKRRRNQLAPAAHP